MSVPELDKTATAPAMISAGPGLASGRQLGHYRVERKLGAGGMGEVYLATDLALDRPVALKVLPSEVARDPVRRDRMIREARSQARVLHPNVGHIYFIGEDNGLLYFAMEYVAGETLGERAAKGAIPVDEALSWIRSAAMGLREAQKSGITHRDVKPSNLMLDGHGIVKVLDFGLAASAPEALDAGGPVQQTSLAGTPLYMAPEQGRGEAIDFRADVYALGATLYHLASGRPPFVAESAMELLSLHASAKRPVLPRGNQPRPAIAAVGALCAKMMAPKPEDRFASYDELIRALELASTEHTRPAGFWVRLMATGIDLLAVSLLVLAVTFLVTFVTNTDTVDLNVYIFGGLALYEILAIKRFGKTIGKALFELEVVELATGARPEWRAAAIRAGVMLGIPAIASGVASILEMLDLETGVYQTITAFSMPLAILALFIAAWRSHGKRALWDRAAGTIVRYRKT